MSKSRQQARDRKEQRLSESCRNVIVTHPRVDKKELIETVDPAQQRQEKIERRHQQKVLLYPDGIKDIHGNPVVEHGQGKDKPQKDQERKEIREQELMKQKSKLEVAKEETGPKAAKTFNDFMLGVRGPIAIHFQNHFENRRFKRNFDRVDAALSLKDEEIKKFKSPMQMYPDPLLFRRNTQDIYESEMLYISNYDITPFIEFVRTFYKENQMSKKTRVSEDDFVIYVYFYYQSILMDMLVHPTVRSTEECSYQTGPRTWMYEGTIPSWSTMFPIPFELLDMIIRSTGAGVKSGKCIFFTPTLLRQGSVYTEWYHSVTYSEEEYQKKEIYVVGRGQGTHQVVDLPQCGFVISHPSHQQVLDLLFKGNTLMRDVVSEKGYWYLPKGLYTYCIILAEELKKMKWFKVRFQDVRRCYNQRFPLVLHDHIKDKQSKVGIPKEHWQRIVELCKMSKFDISGCSATTEDPAWLAGGYLSEA